MTRLEGAYPRPVPQLLLTKRQGGTAANGIFGDLGGAKIALTLAAHWQQQMDFAIRVSRMMDMPFVAGSLIWAAVAARSARYWEVCDLALAQGVQMPLRPALPVAQLEVAT